MRKSRFTEKQIIAILSEQERGMATTEVCRKHGNSERTFYKWKANFGGMQVSDAKKLKSLETENAGAKGLTCVRAAMKSYDQTWLGCSARSRMHEPSLNHRRLRLGCLAGTFNPSRRQIRSARLSFSCHPARRSNSAIRR